MTTPQDSCRDGTCEHIRATTDRVVAKPFQLGSISTGTLKTKDLLHIFAEELQHHNLEARDIDNDLGAITDALQDACPPFVYFGAHCQHKNWICGCPPGDVVDFGFWPDWTMLQPEIDQHCEWGHKKFWLDEYQCMIDVDNDNVTVTDIDGQVLWSTVAH